MKRHDQYGTNRAAVMAYVTLLIIPAAIFYLFTKKFIVSGLRRGTLKGQSSSG